MNEEEGFVSAIASTTGYASEEVKSILDCHRIPLTGEIPRSGHLLLQRIMFSGKKTKKEESDSGQLCLDDSGEPFRFEQKLGVGVWGLGSDSNNAGKTSVLEIIMWALQGESGKLQSDVRHWLEHVELGGAIKHQDSLEPEEFKISFKFNREKNRLRGGLFTGTGHLVGDFKSEETMKTVIDSFLRERLGLLSVPFGQVRKGKGNIVEQGWSFYTDAFYLRQGKKDAVIGEGRRYGPPDKLLPLVLGIPWSHTLFAVQAAQKVFHRGAVQETQKREWEARIAQYQQALAEAEAERDQVATGTDFLAEKGILLQTLESISKECHTTRIALQDKKEKCELLEEQLYAEEKAAIDQEETRIAAGFFRELRPDRCPRCYAEIGFERYQSEREEGTCSVCCRSGAFDADLLDPLLGQAQREVAGGLWQKPTDPNDLVLEKEKIREEREEIAQLEESLSIVEDRYAKTTEKLEKLEETSQRQTLREEELAVAYKKGRLEEAKESFHALFVEDFFFEDGRFDSENLTKERQEKNTAILADLEKELDVLNAALSEAAARQEAASTPLLEKVNEKITSLGQDFGIKELQTAEIDLNAHLFVTKSDTKKIPFKDCTTGEKLRLQIAVLLALFQVSEDQKTGGYPGLILIDAPGADEINAEDAKNILDKLHALTREIAHLQIIIASARPEILDGIFPEQKTVAERGMPLW